MLAKPRSVLKANSVAAMISFRSCLRRAAVLVATASALWSAPVGAQSFVPGQKVKAELKSGETRLMTDNKLAGHEKIGDLQYHHFTIYVPANCKKLTISLAGLAKVNGDTNYNLDLHLKQGGFTFLSAEPTSKSTGSGSEEEITITNPPAGLWYAAVVGKDTVDAKTGSPFVYSGKTGVLNGVAYSIRVDINL